MSLRSENLADQTELAPAQGRNVPLRTICGPLSAEIAPTTNGGPSVDEEDLVEMKVSASPRKPASPLGGPM